MNIAILGFGVVGTGAYEAARTAGVHVKRVLDIAVREGFEDVMTTDIDEIMQDDDITVVVETMGGLHPAYEFISKAFESGKSVVTANKQLVSCYYKELHEMAQSHGVQFRYTASAGGGIPWLFNLRRAKRCDEIEEIDGIINGTTNFILSAMHESGADFDGTLKEAQRLGYAEANPAADIDGLDLQRKCVISASIAFDGVVSEADVPVAGIRSITTWDIKSISGMGRVCKLVATAKQVEGGICAFVQPVLTKKSELMANVGGNFNMVSLTGKAVGRLSFYGQGAGKYPTGVAVIQDVIDISADVGGHSAVGLTPLHTDNTRVEYAYYVRGAELPAELVAEDAEGYCITKALSVSRMFKLYEEYKHTSPDMFFAAID